MYKLDVGTEKGFGALFWIVGNGLEFIYGDINVFAYSVEKVEDALDAVLCVAFVYINGYGGSARLRVYAEGRA